MKIRSQSVLTAACLAVQMLTSSMQFAVGALPPSSLFSLSSANVPTVTMNAVDNAALTAEDEMEQAAAQLAQTTIPYQIAEPLEVHLTLDNSGNWETLANGDRIWRLRILSSGATDLFLLYDAWRLVKPCELWLYNDDRSMILGPFTYIDNWDGTNITPITDGDAVTLEYYVPAGVEDAGELSIMRVLHGYRQFIARHDGNRDPLDAFGDAMPCHINVRCFPDWQDEKKSVAMTINPMGGACSGTMLNNVPQNGAPNFLTANHCLGGNLSNWLFYFNYESPQCNPNANGNLSYVIQNASLQANALPSDFALLRLSRPRPNAPFIPRFEGWDRHDIAPEISISIHHPSADVKKISYDTSPAVSDDYGGSEEPHTHWHCEWDLGTTEPGSSGGPLFDEFSRVVGQCHGGFSDCNVGTEEDVWYGKLSRSWNGPTSTDRLRDWLDPGNTGAWETNAFQPVGPLNDSCGPLGENIPVISSVPYSHSGSTQWASDDYQGGCFANTAPDVFYSLRMNCDYQITISTCGSNFDTQIYVTNAACSPGGAYVICNDDFCGTQSQVTFTAEAGEPYTICIDGYGSAWGNYVINVTGFAAGSQGNAQCPGFPITEIPYFTYGANWCGGDHITPSCRSSDSEDIHWYWVSPYSQAMRAKTCYINYDTILEVRYSGSCPGTWLAGCNDDTYCGLDALASTVVFDAYNGVTFYIHLDGYNGATGMASLELEAYNDDCSSPIVVPSLPANYGGDTRAGVDDFATVVGPSSKELFFKYTSPTCQTMGVSLCDPITTYDTGLEVRTGGPCPGSTLVAYNDDLCGLKSQVIFSAEANRTYYIIVGGYGTNAGPFMAYFYNIPGTPAAPLADVCFGIQVTNLPFTDYGNTNCMADNFADCVGSTSPEMYYSLVRPQCEEVTVSLCGSGYDTGLGVYQGLCPAGGPWVVCNDDNYCGQLYTYQSTVSFTALANTYYQILVHGFSTYSGPYVINVTSYPCNIPPEAVDDQVSQFNPATGDVVLTWGAVPGADIYHIYRSSVFQNLFLPQSLIASVTGTSYTCAGCINDPADRSFFGVTSENYESVTAPPPELPDISMFTKADAVQGQTVLSPEATVPALNAEHTPEWKQAELSNGQ